MTALPPPWDSERDEALVCADMRDETSDVRTFGFRAIEPRLFRFRPGQFMTFTLDAIGAERCWTIASPPTRPFRLEITVKRSGPASSWMHDHLRPGMGLPVTGPHGEFTIGDAVGCAPAAGAPGRLLLLAGGSGITPLMSIARTLHDLGAATDVVLVQSARSPADLLFADELAAMSARPSLRVVNVVESGTRWDGLRGRLTGPMLAAIAPDLLQRDVFCCGPAPYMAAVRALLGAAGYDMARYQEESFAFAPPAQDLPDLPAQDAPAEDGFKILFATSGKTVTCPGGMTILAAARAAGLRLPSACRKGVCGTCKSRMLEGTVQMAHAGGIRQREIDAGLVLLCCSRPASDLVVDR